MAEALGASPDAVDGVGRFIVAENNQNEWAAFVGANSPPCPTSCPQIGMSRHPTPGTAAGKIPEPRHLPYPASLRPKIGTP